MRRCGVCKQRVRWDDPLTWTQLDPSMAAPSVNAFTVGMGVPAAGTLTALACRSCAAQLEGLSPPDPIRYPINTKLEGLAGCAADGTGAIDAFPVCAMCRQALYEGDDIELIRILTEDLDLLPLDAFAVDMALQSGNKTLAADICGRFGHPHPGSYPACPQCVAKYKPALLRRLKRIAPRWFPEDAGLELVNGDWLL